MLPKRSADLGMGENSVREALVYYGAGEDELEAMTSDAHVSKFLGDPSILLLVARDLGIPLGKYFSCDCGTVEGMDRIRQVGLKFKGDGYAVERAEMLAYFAGRGMAGFYEELNIRDLAMVSEYERSFKPIKGKRKIKITAA